MSSARSGIRLDRRITCLCVGFLILVGENDRRLVAADGLNEAIASLNRLVAARSSLLSGELQYRLMQKDDSPEDVVEFEIAFDFREGRQDLRYDTARRKAIVRTNEEVLHVVAKDGRFRERLARTKECVLFYSPDEYTNGTTHSAISGRRSPQPDDRMSQWNQMTDPRVLGLSANIYGHLWNESIEARAKTFRAAGSVAEEVPPTDSSPHRLIVLRAHPTPKVEYAVWVSPDQGDSIVRCESRMKHDGADYITIMEATPKKLESGVWFPSAVTVRRMKGDEVLIDEHLKITRMKFNHDVDPNKFTLAGMDLRPGTPVIEFPDSPVIHRIWDGEKLIVPTTTTLPQGPPEDRRSSWRWIGVNTFAVLAVLCIVGAVRKRRASYP